MVRIGQILSPTQRTVRADGPRGRSAKTSATTARTNDPRKQSARMVRVDGPRGRCARTVPQTARAHLHHQTHRLKAKQDRQQGRQRPLPRWAPYLRNRYAPSWTGTQHRTSVRPRPRRRRHRQHGESECQNWPKVIDEAGAGKRCESRLPFKAVTHNTERVTPLMSLWVLKTVVPFNNGHEGKP